MNEKTLSRLDALSVALLLLWLGMALGFAFLQAPTTFQVLLSTGSKQLSDRFQKIRLTGYRFNLLF